MTSTHAPYPPSWYAASATPLAPCAPLDGALDVDVAILGAGYVGLNAAIELAEAGYPVAVLEAEREGVEIAAAGSVVVGIGVGET